MMDYSWAEKMIIIKWIRCNMLERRLHWYKYVMNIDNDSCVKWWTLKVDGIYGREKLNRNEGWSNKDWSQDARPNKNDDKGLLG